MTRQSAVMVVVLFTAALAQGQTPLRDVIDQRIAEKWQAKGITPATAADDAAFLRRVYLDLCGSIPTHDEARAFLDDGTPDKRAKLIDKLLADPRYSQQQTDYWDLLLFGRDPPGNEADARAGFQRWLRRQFSSNTSYDKIVVAILKAEGNTAEQGAPTFYVQYRNQPADAAVKITQTFLGVQLQCARCHDHPYETWTQLDFYGMAAFLARLEVVGVGEKDGEQRIAIGEKNRGEINFVGPAAEREAGQEGMPVAAKFLLGEMLAEPKPPENAPEEQFEGGKMPPKPKFSRKNALANWVTSRDNPYFARAVTNRVWSQYMGRGLVHPVDNMSDSNKASHPELLDELTKGLVDHNFDLKWYIKELVSTKTYQLASTGSVADERPVWFERARVRPLSAEELAEAWRVAVQYAAIDPETAANVKKGQRFAAVSEYHKQFFGESTDGVDNFLGGMHEHMFMGHGGMDQLFDARPGGLLHKLAEADKNAPWDKRVERMYLTILSRRPRPAETQKFVEYISAEPEQPHARIQDAMWTLMTCSEFRFNH